MSGQQSAVISTSSRWLNLGLHGIQNSEHTWPSWATGGATVSSTNFVVVLVPIRKFHRVRSQPPSKYGGRVTWAYVTKNLTWRLGFLLRRFLHHTGMWFAAGRYYWPPLGVSVHGLWLRPTVHNLVRPFHVALTWRPQSTLGLSTCSGLLFQPLRFHAEASVTTSMVTLA